jgi:three-Cys-motif partner protein
MCGDANDPEHLADVASELNARALVIAYLDPARPRDLHWSTVEFIATQFRYVDLIINLPVNSIMRAIHGAGEGVPGAAGRFLNHPRPWELLAHGTSATIAAIRDHYDQALMALNFLRPARRTVCFPAANPYYDVLVASRHQAGVALWNSSNPLPEDPQLSLEPPGDA